MVKASWAQRLEEAATRNLMVVITMLIELQVVNLVCVCKVLVEWRAAMAMRTGCSGGDFQLDDQLGYAVAAALGSDGLDLVIEGVVS
ncbi:hypothetical protein M0R45_032013 [Rubus argutus]|uniref:Uncharacterized protein n=1 Tax=Rubus argutus TaxID=59490 RepID=A0AAW1WFP1_RUBAR